jgi:hypothetical protein
VTTTTVVSGTLLPNEKLSTGVKMKPKCSHPEGHYVIANYWACPKCDNKKTLKRTSFTEEGAIFWVALHAADVLTAGEHYPLAKSDPKSWWFDILRAKVVGTEYRLGLKVKTIKKVLELEDGRYDSQRHWCEILEKKEF